MLIPVTCTCGKSVSDVADAFNEKKKQLILEKLSKKNEIIDLHKLHDISNDDIYPDMTDFCNKYHITRICCKKTLFTSVNIHELLAKTYLSLQSNNY